METRRVWSQSHSVVGGAPVREASGRRCVWEEMEPAEPTLPSRPGQRADPASGPVNPHVVVPSPSSCLFFGRRTPCLYIALPPAS